jgi:hypothetical protein
MIIILFPRVKLICNSDECPQILLCHRIESFPSTRLQGWASLNRRKSQRAMFAILNGSQHHVQAKHGCSSEYFWIRSCEITSGLLSTNGVETRIDSLFAPLLSTGTLSQDHLDSSRETRQSRRPRMKFSISFQHAFNIIMARFICSGTPMVVSRDPYLGPEQCDSCIALALHRHSRFFLLLMREMSFVVVSWMLV